MPAGSVATRTQSSSERCWDPSAHHALVAARRGEGLERGGDSVPAAPLSWGGARARRRGIAHVTAAGPAREGGRGGSGGREQREALGGSTLAGAVRGPWWAPRTRPRLWAGCPRELDEELEPTERSLLLSQGSLRCGRIGAGGPAHHVASAGADGEPSRGGNLALRAGGGPRLAVLRGCNARLWHGGSEAAGEGSPDRGPGAWGLVSTRRGLQAWSASTGSR